MPYQFSLKKHCKIWFSQDRDCFMPALNQLRLVQYRLKNPDTQLTLIYSSRCLNEDALAKLFAFCRKVNISPIDFDREIEATLFDEQDVALYEFAHLEIEHCLADLSGNMGAASDCTRKLAPVIAKYGFYHDFDNELELKGRTTIELNSAIVFYVKLEDKSQKHRGKTYHYQIPTCSNELLMLAHQADNESALHPDALKALRNIQRQIIENYQLRKWDTVQSFVWGASSPLSKEPFKSIIKYMIQRHPEIEDIWDFRRIFKDNCVYSTMIKEEILRYTVMMISGPASLYSAFGHDASQDYNREIAFGILGGYIPKPYKSFFDMAEACQPLLTDFHTKNAEVDTCDPSVDDAEVDYVARVGTKCDMSWTTLGRMKMRAEETKYQEQLDATLALLPRI